MTTLMDVPAVTGQYEATARPAHWGGVLAMTLCVFALIASEFMPVSLLTPMAADLHVSEGLAGYGIAISGAFAVITSLSISTLAGSMNRKTLLLALTGLMAVSGAVVALAPNYVVYLAGRALIGVVIGGFWSMSAATAIRLVPTAQVPRALAVFNGGNALATVIAAPLGSHLGSVVGWRGAFFCLIPVAAVAFIWQWISLPSMAAERADGSGNVFRLFKRRTVVLGMAACGAFFMGQFTLFTYVRPFLETVTRVDVSTLSLILLAIGIAGFIGTAMIGTFLKGGPVSHPDRHSCSDGGNRARVDPLGCLDVASCSSLRVVGTSGHCGTRRLVELDRGCDAGGGCRSRWRPDGRRDPVGDRIGLHRGRDVVRRQRLPKHVRGERSGSSARCLPDVADVARVGRTGRLSNG